MNCMNETVTIQCLQEVCFSKSSECSGAGGSIAAGVIVTALIAAAISVIIHLALRIWFYRQRMVKGRRTSAKKKSKEIYEVTYGISTQSDGIEITPNVMHRVSTVGNETTPNEECGVPTDGIETAPNEVYGINANT